MEIGCYCLAHGFYQTGARGFHLATLLGEVVGGLILAQSTELRAFGEVNC
jgi:hypothetical protein